MEVVRICDAFEWDYQTYLEQPKWFIDMLIAKRSIDAKQAKKESK